MSDLATEIRTLASAVERPGVNAAAAASVAEATRRFGRLGALAGWWANVHPQGRPGSAALTWAGPGWDDVPVPHLMPVRALPVPPAPAPGEASGEASGDAGGGSPADPVAPLVAAVETADALVDSGVDVVLVHVEADAAARRLVCTMLGLDATEAVGFPRTVRGEVVPTDAEWIRTVATLRDDLRSLREHAGRPADVLAALGDPLLTGAIGLILQLAARRTPMLLAGLGAMACASVVRRTAPAAFTWWQIADTVDDPLHAKLVENANLTPVLAHGAGTDALLGGRVALGVLETAAALVRTGG